jgi:hypothetical protein
MARFLFLPTDFIRFLDDFKFKFPELAGIPIILVSESFAFILKFEDKNPLST